MGGTWGAHAGEQLLATGRVKSLQKLKVLSLIIRTNFCWVLCWRLRSAVERDQLLGELDALLGPRAHENVPYGNRREAQFLVHQPAQRTGQYVV